MDLGFRRAVAEARRHGDLYFAGLLPEDRHSAFGRARWFWQGWIYSPAVTIWVFLAQCLSADHSCREAVARLIAWRLAKGLKRCSAETGAYCTAREQIPEEACRELMRQTGRQVDDEAPPEWRWHARRVLDVDGSTATMPDTPANQAEYPQVSGQRRGCGFPIVRFVVVFSLAVGTVPEAALGKYQGKQTGENSLFRTLHGVLRAGDVVLADRYFSGWFDIAVLQQRGVDIVVRKHQLRATDFRTGQHLGPHDHLVGWSKPARPDWMSQEQYDYANIFPREPTFTRSHTTRCARLKTYSTTDPAPASNSKPQPRSSTENLHPFIAIEFSDRRCFSGWPGRVESFCGDCP